MDESQTIQAFSALLALGGLMGARKGSKISFIASWSTAGLLLFSTQDLSNRRPLAVAVLALLSAGMGFRTIKSGGAPIPTVVTALSALVLMIVMRRL
jgi:uncharacterized membrane protein (UPF0136 family)